VHVAGEEVHGLRHTLIPWIKDGSPIFLFCRTSTMQRAPSGVGKRQTSLRASLDTLVMKGVEVD
jgi:hypothetical protein